MKTKKQPHNFVEDDLIANEDLRKAYLQGYGKGRAEGILIGENNQHNNSGSLKTLEDMQIRNGEVFWKSLPVEELRQEAIKWVKFLDKESDKYKFSSSDWMYYSARRSMLFEFFNLTEEDLK